MRDFGTTVQIQASPERVWAVMRDVERWPEWTSTVTNIAPLDGSPLAVGSRVRILQPKLRPAVWRVTELNDAAKNFTWVTKAPGVRVSASHRVEPEGTGSRATLSLRFSGLFGPLIASFYRCLNKTYLATEAQGLKRRSES